ncbi:MAG: cache domain-containing protein [Nitrospira sp.]|nr:cache domain-containing protein [Nitrospira sp.]
MTTPEPAIEQETQGRKRGLAFGLLTKLVAPSAVMILLVATGIFVAVYQKKDHILGERAAGLENMALIIQEKIDRNLFERYGDVQAFALNSEVRRPLDRLTSAERASLTGTIDAYVKAYGCYALSMVLDASGKVVAINSLDASGQPLPATAKLVGRDFSGADWFEKAKAERYTTDGKPGSLTGTVVSAPQRTPLMDEVYGTRRPNWEMGFTAPIRTTDGQVMGYWHNVVSSPTVERIAESQYDSFKRQDLASAEITIVDGKGNLLVDVDPSVLTEEQGSRARRDPDGRLRPKLPDPGFRRLRFDDPGPRGHHRVHGRHCRAPVDDRRGGRDRRDPGHRGRVGLGATRGGAGEPHSRRGWRPGSR